MVNKLDKYWKKCLSIWNEIMKEENMLLDFLLPRLYFVKAIENFNRFIADTYIFETKRHQTNSSYIMSINSIKTYFYMKNNNYILKSFQNLLKVILWY